MNNMTRKLVGLVACAALGVACAAESSAPEGPTSSDPPSAQEGEHVGTTSSALLGLGQPCTDGSQCTSGCCATNTGTCAGANSTYCGGGGGGGGTGYCIFNSAGRLVCL